MILAFAFAAVILFVIWRIVNKKESNDVDYINYVKIEPKDENKGTNDNG